MFANAKNQLKIIINAFQALKCSTSCPGGDLVDGLPPASSNSGIMLSQLVYFVCSNIFTGERVYFENCSKFDHHNSEFVFFQKRLSHSKDWCQIFCNSIVLRGLKLPVKGAKFCRKMLFFVKFRKAILGHKSNLLGQLPNFG